MTLLCEESSLEKQEKLLRDQLGRELTGRERFYLALAEACAPVQQPSQLGTAEKNLNVSSGEALAPSLKPGRPLILSIDDDETQLALRKDILENHGFLVLNATNARDAVRILRETPVSLVLSDHMLRGTTGTRLAGRLKKVKPDVPVVLYSGSSPKFLLNVDCFINKTEPVLSFLAIISDLLDQHWT